MTENNSFNLLDKNMPILYFALDNISEGAYLVDKKGFIRYVNAQACHILGYTSKELLSMNVSDFDPNYPDERWTNHWKELIDKSSLTFESQHRTKDGKIVHVEINANYFVYNNQEFNLGLVRNITERKRTEREHNEYLNFLSTMDRINQTIQASSDLDQMMSDVLDNVISIFDCDRAWLLHPLDPDAHSFRVPKIRWKENFAISFPEGGMIKLVPESKKAFHFILESQKPVTFGPSNTYPTPNQLITVFGVVSQIAMAIFPKTGKPWMFGLHQCSRERIWTAEEIKTFEQIGSRLGDALSSMIYYQNLQQSEEKCRRIIETSQEGIMILDINGIVSFVNKRMADILFYTEEEILGHSPTDFMFEEDKADHTLKLQSRQKKITEIYDRQFRRKDGKKIWTLVSVTPLFKDDGEYNGSFAMISDITERKQMEEVLQENEKRYHDIFDNVLDGVYLLEVTNDGRFRNIEMNPAFEKSTGIPRSELIGKFIEETVDKQVADIAIAKYRHCVEAGHPIEEEAILDLPIGRRFYHSSLIPVRDSNGKINRIIGISRDQTDKKLAEEEILKLNRLYKTLASCNEALVHAKCEDELLNKICEIIVNEGGYRMAWVGFSQTDENQSVKPVAFAGYENGYLQNIKISWADNIYGRGPTGKAIRTGKFEKIDEFSSKDYSVWKDNAEKRRYKSSAAFPLITDGKTLGALSIYSEFQNGFNTRELELLQELANDLAYGIINIRTKIEREKAILLLNEAQKMAHIGNWEYNITEDRFTWSDEIFRIFEVEKDILNGSIEDFAIRVHPDDKELVDTTFKSSIRTKTAYSLTHRLLFPDGRIKFVHVQGKTYSDESGNPIRTLGATQDITEAKLAEQEKLSNLRFVETMDKVNRAMQVSKDLNQMMISVLDIVLEVFNCDRAFLLYPCDPNTKTWTVPMECTKPEYPGVLDLNLEMKIDSDVARTFQILLDSSKPVKFGAKSSYPLPLDVSRRFGFQSILSMAIYPKIGKPWQFGLHQCSYPREWSTNDEKLLEEIGRRLEDSLTSLLTLRDLQISEERYRLVFENSPVSLWEEDLSDINILLDDLKKSGIQDIESYLSEHPDVIQKCVELVKVLNVNRAAIDLHGATSKEDLFAGLINLFTPESMETFKQEVICIWDRKTYISRDSVIKTLDGEIKYVSISFSVCLGFEDSLSKVIVSLTDITERKKIEADLRQSESRYRFLYNNTPVMLHSINKEGKLVSVSDYWLATMGYSRDEVIGRSSTDFLTNSSRQYATEIVLPEFMKNGYCYNIEYQFVKKNGKVIDCLLSAISEQDKEGNIIRSLAVITDITERKKVDQALRESEEQYRTLIEKIQAAVVVHNADTSILMSNSLAQEFLGLTRDQMLGKMSIDPYWHFSDENGKYVDIDKYPVNLVLSTGKKLRNYVLRVHRPSLENEVWVLVNADPVYNKDKQIIQVIVTFIDITQRKKAQSDLEEERKLFIGGPNVAFKWKSDEGWSIEYVSPNIAKVFGYSPEYLMNSKIKYINLIHQNDLKYITDEIRINEEKKLSYFELEYRIIRADGEPRWIYNFITVVRDSNGEVTHYNGHIIDITEDKQAKDEIQKLNLNLEQRVAERTKQLESLNKELESFSYSISHDLREPLFHIEGYIRLLEEKVNSSLDNEGRSFISSIYKSTKHMTHLIDDILTFSRTGYQELIFNSVDMSKLVDDVIVEFKTEFLNRTIHWNISSLPEVKGDKILLHQVFTNLISNAIKFSAHKTQAKIDIGHLVSESENIFYVRDNGAGFDMKFVNRLFNTFERLHSKEEYKGTGIGLANVRRIIERHGGRTWADGEVNKGATFYFSIPNEIIR